jgi:hypothetical protein
MASVNSTSGSTPPERGEPGAYVQFGCGLEFRQTLRNVHLDFKNMARELEAAGFTDVRRAQCRDNPEEGRNPA